MFMCLPFKNFYVHWLIIIVVVILNVPCAFLLMGSLWLLPWSRPQHHVTSARFLSSVTGEEPQWNGSPKVPHTLLRWSLGVQGGPVGGWGMEKQTQFSIGDICLFLSPQWPISRHNVAP